MVLELEVLKTSGKLLGTVTLQDSATIKTLKDEIANKFQIPIEQQSIRKAPKGSAEKDSGKITGISLETPGKIYVKDLGPQIGWDTVFFCEYAGPIFCYGLLFFLPHWFYSASYWPESTRGEAKFPFNMFPIYHLNSILGDPKAINHDCTVYVAGIMWTVHYSKRILETAFVHRFSHGTMPIFNLFKNCSYYWGFAFYISYYINHPLHTAPPKVIFYLGCIIFIVCELGNLSIHLALRDLRPAGTNVRKIPLPNWNPLTKLFNYVSCPNYTYEFGAWFGFTLITGSLPVFIFALAGLAQMSVWAIGKHKRYVSEFNNYPKRRKAILPFLI